MPYRRFAPPYSAPDWLRITTSVASSHDAWVSARPVVHFDDTGAVAEQEFDHFLVDAARDAVAAHAPVTALAQIGAHVLALGVEAPGPGLPIEVRAAVVRDDNLLTEGVVAGLVVSFTFAAPDTDEGEKREEFGIDIRAEGAGLRCPPATEGSGRVGMLSDAVDLERSTAMATASSPLPRLTAPAAAESSAVASDPESGA